MEIKENEGGGETAVLVAGDSLAAVPESHRGLITPAIREAFVNPPAYFAAMANRCPFSQMSQWLRALVATGRWELHLNQGEPEEWTLAGFDWTSDGVRGATVELPDSADLTCFPEELRRYYSLVSEVSWNGFGCAGGLSGAGGGPPLTFFPFEYHGDPVDLAASFVWGFSPCGDVVVFTQDGRGGWLNHETYQIHLLGTIGEAVNWIFAELLAKRGPEWDERWSAADER